MPSRKRHQGKARKAKQRSEPKGLVKKCKHFIHFPPLDSSLETLKCREFVKLWKRTLERETDIINAAFISEDITQRLLQQTPCIWQSSSNKDLVRMLFVRTGTAHIGRINSHPVSRKSSISEILKSYP